MDKLLLPPPLASDERFSILANIAAERFAQSYKWMAFTTSRWICPAKRYYRRTNGRNVRLLT
ncbi:phage tail protein [Salmonella enterica subsp. enterica serovar Hartford str. CFSAN001075]|nr:phage tail protein [Salmonella enterica subsp. enterica serovar Hartford str. CFSAN001075]